MIISAYLLPKWFAKGLYKCDSCGFIQRDCKKHSSIDLCPCGADDWSQNYGNNNERDQPMKEVS
jgi:hypothetical protein